MLYNITIAALDAGFFGTVAQYKTIKAARRCFDRTVNDARDALAVDWDIFLTRGPETIAHTKSRGGVET